MPDYAWYGYSQPRKKEPWQKKQERREKEAKERWAYAMKQLSPQERENFRVSGFIR